MQLIWGRQEVYTGFWWENLMERHHCEDPGLDEIIILRWIFRKWEERAWTGLVSLRLGTGGGLFETR